MVQGEHRVRLTAAEVRLQLNDRIALLTGESLDGANEHLLQTVREVSSAEELFWFPVLVRSFTDVDLPKIRGEFRLLVPAARNVLVRRHDFAPRLECAGRLAFDGGAGGATLLRAHLLVEAYAEDESSARYESSLENGF